MSILLLPPFDFLLNYIIYSFSFKFIKYVVSVPLRMLKPWCFLSMLMQVPLAILTSYLKNPWGNFMVWLSLIIGQPLAIMMYYHDYIVEHNTGVRSWFWRVGDFLWGQKRPCCADSWRWYFVIGIDLLCVHLLWNALYREFLNNVHCNLSCFLGDALSSLVKLVLCLILFSYNHSFRWTAGLFWL